MWGAMFFGFGTAGTETYLKFRSVGVALISCMWSAIVNAVTLVLYAFLIGLVFTASGSQISAIRNLFEGASTHLLLAPALALVVGVASTLVCSISCSMARRTIVMLGCLDILSLLAGLYAIHFASALERAARPPFIVFGLAALCLSLASAYPLAAALQLRQS